MVSRKSTVALASALFGVSASARAAEPASGNEAAKAIFDDARKLDEAGDLARACPRYAEALELEPNAVGGRLHLARCYERSGRLASAAHEYEVAATAASSAGQGERAAYALRQRQLLTPRLGTVALDVPRAVRETALGLELTRDGVTLAESTWGVPLPVDAGPHRFEAAAPGRATWSSSVDVVDGVASRLEVPILARRHRVVWPWVAGGIGLALGGVGAAFALDQAKTQALVHDHCSATACDRADGFDPATVNARLDRDFALAVGLGVAGGVALGAGIVGLATSPAGTSSARVSPWFGPRTAGIAASWLFE